MYVCVCVCVCLHRARVCACVRAYVLRRVLQNVCVCVCVCVSPSLTFTYRKYAINDIAPGICADGTGRNTGWLNQKVLALLQGIRDARAIDDFGRVKFLQGQLRELAGELSIPLHTLGQIVVPNCTDDQKTLLHSVIRRMISSSPLTA